MALPSCGRGVVRLSIVVIAAVAFVVAGEEEEAPSDPFLLPAHHAERMRQGGGGSGGSGSGGGGWPCWGYEPDCPFDRAFRAGEGISCDPGRDPYTGRDSRRVFFDQADFGYLAKIGSSMWELCHGDGGEGGDGGVGGSTFSCSENLLFCHRRNVMVNLREVQRERRSLRYQMDVLRKGQIGGSCRTLDLEMLESHLEHMAPLQSWAPELRNFANLSSPVDGEGSSLCDVWVEEPTYLMKLDATVNYYHHFCDFLNLYLSLHLVYSLGGHSDSAFSRDNHILVWDNTNYASNFGAAFSAFTSFPVLDLTSFGARRVCFRRLFLPLLPRMFFGLYYNTPLAPGCRNSGIFAAFSEFMLHRLGIPDRLETDSQRSRRPLSVTLLSRRTQHRRVLNEPELIRALEDTRRYEVTVADFSHRTDFLAQLRVVRHTDILVGVHGAGLTHLLFLPDWGAVFELYDCGDPGCYQDLSRLRGLSYVGWTEREGPLAPRPDRDPKEVDRSTAYEKFSSYTFDAAEFVRKVDEAAAKVLAHPKFKATDRTKINSDDREEL